MGKRPPRSPPWGTGSQKLSVTLSDWSRDLPDFSYPEACSRTPRGERARFREPGWRRRGKGLEGRPGPIFTF